MKLKNMINTLLVTITIGASGSASAGALPWGWSGSLQNWETLGSVIDKNPPLPSVGTSTPAGTGDGDTTFTYLSSNNFDVLNTSIGLTEQEVGGVDLYNLGVGFVTGQLAGSIAYQISTTEAAGLNLTSLASLVTVGGNGGEVKEDIYDHKGGTLLLSLDSKNNAVVPASGLAAFTGQKSVYVVDTIASNSGPIQDFHNNFSSSVPEPETLAMLLIGLPMLGWKSRRKQAINVVIA
ncbi:PEP-CTERM sorting domain-containing protein [Methylomonas sp. AM2-LC]|uniref:PEP-CTERM sorting domain-containing protein n=1 Tax=Methylomonas sp. AM2-LC TaxID=3153301 RepID=UPI0032640B50